MTIRGLRILPPLALARLGSSPQPLENYDVRVDDNRPLGFRRIFGAETFIVNRRSGAIERTYIPKQVHFRDRQQRVKPVAPFLEAWADIGGTLVPLTESLAAGATIEWRVRVANHKAFRRTGKMDDRIEADTGWFDSHHLRPLLGKCRNFLRGKVLPFGSVRLIRPTHAYPQIRLRFTPAKGFVYGATKNAADGDVNEVIYDARRGTWSGYSDADLRYDALSTNPAYIYANQADNRTSSRGYLDDECDGIVEVRLSQKDGSAVLSAMARVVAGPPDYAPDSFPVRTVADELEQVLLGSEVAPEDVSAQWTQEIIRRAFETIRLQNTIVLNGNPVLNGGAANSMPSQDTDWNRTAAPIMATALVDTLALQALHQGVLTALRGETAAWFGQVLREYDQVGDLTDAGRRKMPALMRNSDGLYLALTRRQLDAVRQSGNAAATAADPKAVTFTVPMSPAEKKR